MALFLLGGSAKGDVLETSGALNSDGPSWVKAVIQLSKPVPTIAPVEAEAKAVVQDTGLAEVLKKPEAWGPFGGFLAAAGAIFAGAGPIQWALAILMIAGGIVGLLYFIQRIRSGG